MDTLTSTATKAVSNTKLAIATLALFVAGGAALAAAPLNSMSSAYGWSGCVDPDNVSAVYGPTNPFDQKQLFSKAVTKYNKGSKTDYCYTFPKTGNTRLMEGICNAKGSFATWQKNCAELNRTKQGSNYQCVDGACEDKAAVLLPDLYVSYANSGVYTGSTSTYAIVATITNNGDAPANAPFYVDFKVNGIDGKWRDLADKGNIVIQQKYSSQLLENNTVLRIKVDGIYMSPTEFTSTVGVGNVVGLNLLLPQYLVLNNDGSKSSVSFLVKADSTGLVNEKNEGNNQSIFMFK